MRRYITIKNIPLYKVVINSGSDRKKVVSTTRDKDKALLVLQAYLSVKKYQNVSLVVENETRYSLVD